MWIMLESCSIFRVMDLKESVFKFCAVPDFEFLVSFELPLLFLEDFPFLFLVSDEPCC